jgi:hypothetical protein
MQQETTIRSSNTIRWRHTNGIVVLWRQVQHVEDELRAIERIELGAAMKLGVGAMRFAGTSVAAHSLRERPISQQAAF